VALLAVLAPLPDALAQGGPRKKQVKDEEKLHIEDNLTPDEPFDKQRPFDGKMGCHFKVHLYRMNAGETYTIDLVTTKGAGLNDPYLRLEDSKGIQLAQDDDGGGYPNARIIVRAPRTETYRLIATTFRPGDVGRYALIARRGGIAAGPGGMAVGAPAERKFDDITVAAEPLVLSPFGTGGNQAGHGYVEFRLTVSNSSTTDSHRVTLTLPRYRGGRPSGPYLYSLSRTVEVGPDAEVSVTLLQPDLALYDNRNLAVTIDGVEQRDSVSLNASAARGSSSAGYYSPTPTLGLEILAGDTGLAMSLNNNIFRAAAAAPAGGVAGGYRHFQSCSQDLPDWSKRWLAYSSYDGLVLSADQVRAAPATVREALWRYVECGGSLLILGPAKVPDAWQRKVHEKDGLTTYYGGFGECLVGPIGNVDQWAPQRFARLAKAWDNTAQPWQRQRTITEANNDFPVVDNVSIPVRGLFALMLIFTLGIGPVNLYVLSRKKRRMWLLWTVPAVSAVTCLAVLSFMLVAEGWTGRVRAEGLTILDQGARRASTIGWIGYYTPVAPSDGLHFSADTELTAQVAAGRYRHSRPSMAYVLDWTGDMQHLVSGWVTARVPAHFMVRRSEDRREQVALRRNPDGSLAAVNRLGVPIKQLWLADHDGRIYTAADLPAGPETTLAPHGTALAKGGPAGLRELYGRDWLQHYKSLTTRPEDYLLPDCYLAVLESTPFMEEGMRGARPRNSRSVVYGIMTGKEQD
jgi:hypothetical protein